MKAVFDTNVLISALIKAGKPRDLLFRMVNEETLVLSKGIIEEFLTVAQDARIRKYVNSRDVEVFQGFLNTHAKLVRVSSKFSVVEADPNDDVILRTAYDAKANYVVSGDGHLLSLGEFRGIRIVTINEMMQLLETKTTR
jgi:putative PIN family toxin of toxin-antitoxin system